MKPTRTWILIADGARARILEHLGPGHEVRALGAETFTMESRPSRELGSDRPGRVVESVGSQRHAIEPKYDPHRGLETLFAHQLGDILGQRLEDGLYDRLIIVAAPTMLGDLRKALSKAVEAHVVAEVAKDLTKVPNNEILGHLAGVDRL